jgi:hypothetical protein
MKRVSSALTLSTAARRGFDRLAADVRRVFGPRFVALVATGGGRSVAFADRITPGDLDALGALVETWHRDGLEAPLLMTPHEFRRSLDTFPLEYQSILDRHIVIAGTPPFDNAKVAPDELRRACEVHAKGHVIHLRQGWLESAGHDDKLEQLAASSAEPLAALLANVARLSGDRADGSERAIAGARLAGLDEVLIQRVLMLQDGPAAPPLSADDLHRYLEAAEQLWAFVDGWHEDAV